MEPLPGSFKMLQAYLRIRLGGGSLRGELTRSPRCEEAWRLTRIAWRLVSEDRSFIHVSFCELCHNYVNYVSFLWFPPSLEQLLPRCLFHCCSSRLVAPCNLMWLKRLKPAHIAVQRETQSDTETQSRSFWNVLNHPQKCWDACSSAEVSVYSCQHYL